MQQQTAGLDWQQEGQLSCLHVTGHWTLHQRKPDLLEVWRKGGRLPEQLCVRVNVTAWDSSLLALLRRIRYLAYEAGIEVNLQGLPAGVGQLLEMAQTPSTQAQAEPKTPLNRVAQFGAGALRVMGSMGRSCTFIGQVTLALLATARGKGRMRASDFWLALQQNGPGALPIVALIAVLVGLILAFVGAVQLEAFGAQIYIANMVAIGMTREMGALMTAVIMAGRTGAAYAAELGSMQANEEIDALQTFGFPPLEFLVTPRILALLVSMPILTCFADALGILGGFVIGWGMYDISATQYINQSLVMVSSIDFFIGLFKSLVFALLIGMIGCYYGLNSGRNAQAVGQATTNAVVSIIVALVVSDAMITVLCTQLGI
ncbi:ABC transporter permease [Thiopseudomonas denitrificans]|uniref:Phospholipid/cholesterol/gamma-HCH transport system permease protein n=1 Tax=Thiopseudomonas denitrificans TaxID=1501432 RepID=A0A4R6TZL1_9GAMM|nr:ABC transporter permease [Thiopseudomonas denitrificans]TDQ37509.1 phospholipid/cholesterol/gamma-HCH transport system permease protein [Thiopseudomonas denitrificans]